VNNASCFPLWLAHSSSLTPFGMCLLIIYCVQVNNICVQVANHCQDQNLHHCHFLIISSVISEVTLAIVFDRHCLLKWPWRLHQWHVAFLAGTVAWGENLFHISAGRISVFGGKCLVVGWLLFGGFISCFLYLEVWLLLTESICSLVSTECFKAYCSSCTAALCLTIVVS